MPDSGDTLPPDRSRLDSGGVVIGVGRILGLLLVAVSVLVAALRLAGAGPYLVSLASRGTVFNVWGALAVLEVLFALAAISGAGFGLLRRRLLLAVLFSALAWPVGLVVEGSRCDTESSCRTLGWAAFPERARKWSVRIRPVTDRNEAASIAAEALFNAGSGYHTYEAKRFSDHWIVPTIDEDGRPGTGAVKIDARTAAASFVPCPADRMLCGMERPVVAQARQVFSNGRRGLIMTFPAGRAVCIARPEDEVWRLEARGFYAMIRDPDIPCDILDTSRAMGLEALTAHPELEARPGSCRPLSPATLKVFGGRAPGFADHRSMACEEIAEGQIAVSVFSLAGQRSRDGSSKTPLYAAWMLTDPVHLAEDARTFDVFLRTARIGFPASS